MRFAKAMAEAREKEHRMEVQADVALKAQHDKDLKRERAAKEVATSLAHRK